MIEDQNTIGFSGFTPAGAAKAIPTALARRAQAEHAAGRPFKVGVVTGASTGDSLDGELSRANAVLFRTPYQSNPHLRKAINSGEAHFFDMHLSMLPQAARYGHLGHFNFAVVEAAAVSPTPRRRGGTGASCRRADRRGRKGRCGEHSQAKESAGACSCNSISAGMQIETPPAVPFRPSCQKVSYPRSLCFSRSGTAWPRRAWSPPRGTPSRARTRRARSHASPRAAPAVARRGGRPPCAPRRAIRTPRPRSQQTAWELRWHENPSVDHQPQKNSLVCTECI